MTRSAVSGTVRRVIGSQKTELSTICRIATADNTTFRARHGSPLPDMKLAEKTINTYRSPATGYPAIVLQFMEEDEKVYPIFIMSGADLGI